MEPIAGVFVGNLLKKICESSVILHLHDGTMQSAASIYQSDWSLMCHKPYRILLASDSGQILYGVTGTHQIPGAYTYPNMTGKYIFEQNIGQHAGRMCFVSFGLCCYPAS